MTLGVTVATCPEALHLRFSQQTLRCMDGWADGQVDGWVDSEMLKMLRGKLKKTCYNSSWQTGQVNKRQCGKEKEKSHLGNTLTLNSQGRWQKHYLRSNLPAVGVRNPHLSVLGSV